MESLPTPPFSGSTRSRRGERSSSGESGRGTFGISAVKYRVGAPPLPPLPYTYTDDLPEVQQLRDQFAKTFVRLAKAILQNHQITPFQLDDMEEEDGDEVVDGGFNCVVGDEPTFALTRRSLPDTGDSEMVFCIIACWEASSLQTWVAAAKDFKTLIDQELDDAGLHGTEIGVEISAPEVRFRRYTSVVEYNAGLVRDWPEIKDRVFTELQRFENTKDEMTSISLFRFGLSENPARNPITVYVTVGYAAKENTWPPVVDAIQSRLDQFPYSLVLHLEHGSIVPYTFEHLPATLPTNPKRINLDDEFKVLHDYPHRPSPGDDISAAKYLFKPDGKMVNAALGTFGCYIEIKTLRDPIWRAYGLTNYHVVAPCMDGFRIRSTGEMDSPIPGSEAQKAGIFGFTPSKADNMQAMESPSRKRHNYVLSALDFLIKKEEKEPVSFGGPAREMRQSKKLFFETQNNIFGIPFCGSGLTALTRENARLDWALFRVESTRLGLNNIPPVITWENGLSNNPGPSRLMNFHPDRSLKKLAFDQDAIYKVGATTGKTTGCVSMYKSDVTMWKKAGYFQKSTECCVVNISNGDMARAGDSGSIVYNSHAEVVGILFSGPKDPTSAARYAFVTPIEDVFDHIKQLAKGQVTDIRVAS